MLAKELLRDIPTDNFAPLTMLDSAADMACIAAGLSFVLWQVRRALALGR